MYLFSIYPFRISALKLISRSFLENIANWINYFKHNRHPTEHSSSLKTLAFRPPDISVWHNKVTLVVLRAFILQFIHEFSVNICPLYLTKWNIHECQNRFVPSDVFKKVLFVTDH